MEKRPQALLLKFPGTNCDAETRRALELVGFGTTLLPTAELTPRHLEPADLVLFSGGFSYGDYIMAGRLAQLRLEEKVGGALKEFVAAGGCLLGICNGFQILTKTGLLPGGSLIDNSSGRFVCRWAGLRVEAPESPFLQGVPRELELPVAHAEGRFVSERAVQELRDAGAIALTYAENFNGSAAAIAGLQDETGRVLGLMPHPERFLHRRHHYDPDWQGEGERGTGYSFFQSIYQHLLSPTS
ncbi:MAG: phosphoribosylformylglycinamidine synthase I [Verrucomicrobiota bacterium]